MYNLTSAISISRSRGIAGSYVETGVSVQDDAACEVAQRADDSASFVI